MIFKLFTPLVVPEGIANVGAVRLTMKKSVDKNEKNVFDYSQSLVHLFFLFTNLNPIPAGEPYDTEKSPEIHAKPAPEFRKKYRRAGRAGN